MKLLKALDKNEQNFDSQENGGKQQQVRLENDKVNTTGAQSNKEKHFTAKNS